LNNFDWLDSWAAAVSQGPWVKRDVQIARLNQTIADREGRITNLDLMLAEREAGSIS
jgi:hypothetical protein